MSWWWSAGGECWRTHRPRFVYGLYCFMGRLSAAAHDLLNLGLPDETVYHQDQGLLFGIDANNYEPVLAF